MRKIKRINKLDKNTIKRENKLDKNTLVFDANLSERTLNLLNIFQDELGIILNKETKMEDLSNVSLKQFLKCISESTDSVRELKKVCNSFKINLLNEDSLIDGETKVYDTDISTRCWNLLRWHQDRLGIKFDYNTKMKELSKVSAKEFLRCEMAGTKSLKDLKDLCHSANIDLLP